MMLRTLLAMLLLFLPGLVLAQDLRPAETPPGDFAPRQYIDSKGCVFLRSGQGGWQARRSRDGAALCGYPPTLSVRGIGGKPRLRALDADAGRSRAERLRQALSLQVLTNVLPGELVGDPQQPAGLPDLGPEPADPAPAEQLRAAVAAMPAVRQGTSAGLKPNLRLCRLLGYDDGRTAAAAPGRDPSEGYCGSLTPADLSRLSFARPAGSASPPPDDQPQPAAAVAEAMPSARKVIGPATGETNALPGSARQGSTGSGAAAPAGKQAIAAARPGSARAAPVGMIPAGARYVQLGRFSDIGDADQALQRLADLGYRVLRGSDGVDGHVVQIIMAGPFPDREAIVRGLDAIRRAGYRQAFAR
jgi:cell division septation protein DedD